MLLSQSDLLVRLVRLLLNLLLDLQRLLLLYVGDHLLHQEVVVPHDLLFSQQQLQTDQLQAPLLPVHVDHPVLLVLEALGRDDLQDLRLLWDWEPQFGR